MARHTIEDEISPHQMHHRNGGLRRKGVAALVFTSTYQDNLVAVVGARRVMLKGEETVTLDVAVEYPSWDDEVSTADLLMSACSTKLGLELDRRAHLQEWIHVPSHFFKKSIVDGSTAPDKLGVDVFMTFLPFSLVSRALLPPDRDKEPGCLGRAFAGIDSMVRDGRRSPLEMRRLSKAMVRQGFDLGGQFGLFRKHHEDWNRR